MDSRCCAKHAIFPLTDNERGACDAALHLSQHTMIELLPNVHINEKMELSGFHFEGAGCDTANVLPIPSNMFDCIVAYEVIHDIHTSFNDKVLQILLNMEEYKQKLSGGETIARGGGGLQRESESERGERARERVE
jgi:hypothetical protein